jgi:hypothetical protein
MHVALVAIYISCNSVVIKYIESGINFSQVKVSSIKDMQSLIVGFTGRDSGTYEGYRLKGPAVRGLRGNSIIL